MENDFKYLVALYISAVAFEKTGMEKSAKDCWEKIAGASDIILSVAETEPGGLFEDQSMS